MLSKCPYWTEKKAILFIDVLMEHLSIIMQVGLIATPDVHSFELTKKDRFVILGCDGLWGVCPFPFLLHISFCLIGLFQTFSHIYEKFDSFCIPRYLDQVMLLNLFRIS